jgi:hypothetical protein
MNGSPANPSPCTTVGTWKQRYEALRQLALTGSRILGADPLGWVLLLSQGMAGWRRAWAGLAQTPPSAPVPALPPIGAPNPLSALDLSLGGGGIVPVELAMAI